MKVFLVIADYRPTNQNKPTYEVVAKNERVCKQGFQKKFPWLKVYSVTEVSKEPNQNMIWVSEWGQKF